MTEDIMTARTVTATLDINTSFPSTQSEHAILDHFLAMARAYRVEGSVFNAMDILWKLVESYPNTPQAEESKNTLLEIAVQYERDGLRHPAYAIYERLL